MPADLKDKVAMIPAGELPDVWPEILPGLHVVQKKAGTDAFDLIYQRLTDNEAFLFRAPEGFFILLPIYRERPAVLLWIAYGIGGGLFSRYMPLIEAMARDIGAEAVEIESPRRGYRRVLKNWQRTGNRYTRRLT